MRGEIVLSKHETPFLQVEGGGSWNADRIAEAIADEVFWEKHPELAELLYAAKEKMDKGEIGPVYSEDEKDIE